MKPNQNDQLEMILSRLDRGESLHSIQADLGESADEYIELLTFMQAQTIPRKPNPEGLKQALKQAALLEEEAASDEWGAFMRLWKPLVGLSLSLFVVGIITADMWLNPTTSPNTFVAEPADLALKSVPEAVPMMARSQMAPMSLEMADLALDSEEAAFAEVDETSDLLESWQAEFASDMADFETTKADLEQFYEDPLFSAVTPNQL
jgi:hypothetical protein